MQTVVKTVEQTDAHYNYAHFRKISQHCWSLLDMRMRKDLIAPLFL